MIQERTFKFALTTIQLYQQMIKRNDFVLSKQLLRSGTSIGANVEEALGGQSKKDFLSKMNIALKESRETNYWLRLLNETKHLDLDYNPLLKESVELQSILSAIVKSTRQNLALQKTND